MMEIICNETDIAEVQLEVSPRACCCSGGTLKDEAGQEMVAA